MIEHIFVHKGTYRDSAFLMRLAMEVRRLDGIEASEVLMGTPMNLSLLRSAFPKASVPDASPMDLVVAIRASSERALDEAIAEIQRAMAGGEAPSKGRRAFVPGGVAEAIAALPEANVVSIAVPGPYAAFLAHRALDLGRHVFLFSDNVPLEDEVALKRRARDAGLLVMGPDCGTAIIAGVGLGFANRVPRGPVGVVGASGTGIQEVTSLLAQSGVGTSHAIGVGSRDLSREVAGLMSLLALELLAKDRETLALVLVAKHPDREVAKRVHEVLRTLGKPVTVRYLGEDGAGEVDGVFYARTLDEAAARAARAIGAEVPPPPAGDGGAVGGRLVGLFGGGSLAAEARCVLGRYGIQTQVPEVALRPGAPVPEGNLIVDLGDDCYTVGRPHPMVDQTLRCEMIRAIGADPSVTVLLMDLVLGDGAHKDPAPELLDALKGAHFKKVICSVTGTDKDPQDLRRQVSVLEAAGVVVRPSAALAASWIGERWQA